MKLKLAQLAPELFALALLVALPLIGILLAGLPLSQYTEIPPQTHYVVHAGFAWPVFIAMAAIILLVITPFVLRVILPQRTANATLQTLVAQHLPRKPLAPPLLPPNQRRFPWWGWCGIVFGVGAWILAWSRFAWFEPLQAFTFSPLWFAYIIVVNALTYRRTGQCMLTHRPRYVLLLFPVSALFWWFFEYLNRFVQNWYYDGVGALSALKYFVFATLPFSTVLPAVMGTFDLLASVPRLHAGLTYAFPAPRFHANRLAGVVLIIAMAGLAGIGMWPDYLFPLLWLAPLGVLASIQTLAGRTTLFADLGRGDWRRIGLLALASLICGIFWEMWNYYSLARWIYAVPFVNRFHIFEMPILGYAGYLPFGLECAVIADRVANWCEQQA